MVVAPVDSAYMREHKVLNLKIEYRKRFGEPFIPFNYCDFQRVGDKCAAQIYTEELERACVKGNKLHGFQMVPARQPGRSLKQNDLSAGRHSVVPSFFHASK